MATHHKRRPPGYEEISYPVAAAPWEREDWEARKKEIVSTAKEVVDLYERLGKVLGEGGKRVGGYGHNREPEQLELRVTVLADETKAHKNIDELQRELSSGTPRKRVLSRLGHALNKLRAGAEAIAKKLKEGVLEGIGKTAKGAIGSVIADSLSKALKYLSELVHGLL